MKSQKHQLKWKLAWPVCTEDGVEIKMVHEQWLQLKTKFCWVVRWNCYLLGEWAFARENWKFGGGVFTEGGDFSWWVDRGAEGWVNFQLVGGLPYPPSRENPMIDQSFLH